MIDYTILKKSRKSYARLGIVKTPHGEVETPAFVPVATLGAIKTLTSRDITDTKSQIIIANTYHLHVTSGEEVVARAGGLHTFMNWNGPIMTDSGGFQVFSLGFGRDFNVGKLMKFFPGKDTEYVHAHSIPQNLKITDEGVYFRSPIDGSALFIGPKESMKIQEKLGADIIFAFDECTPPLSNKAYVRKALNRTHTWALTCIQAKRSTQAIFGIVQGSRFKNLRIESAHYIDTLGFDGYGIGGDLGESKETMGKILQWVIPNLTERKPRHLLGIGHIEDMEPIIKNGIDLFDCTAPTHYARRGTVFTSRGKLNIRKKSFLKENEPLDPKCSCLVCQTYSRSYLSHLIGSREISGMSLLSYHNVHYFNSYVGLLRQKIKEGKL
ncbi:tRNA guanosine(34) transglycosylase Tgt [Candidatus Gottesmanbacteria bacterium]|nr:tRNA guanosine(34) transglycosylase Tgt [Candidatus Gottesmanbacteria bacterium]